MELTGDLAVLQREHDLDQARHAGGGLQMADVGLHRADGAGVVPIAEDRAERADLDGVTQGRAGAVGLDVDHLVWARPGVGQGRADDPLLGDAVGRGEAVGAAILVDGGAPDEGVDPIAALLRRGRALQHDHAAAFAAHVAVGGGVEGLASAIGGEHVRPGEGVRGLGREQEVDAADDGAADLPGAKGLAGEVQRHQGRGAGRIYGDRRPAQVKQVAQTVCGDAVRVARAAVGVGALGVGEADQRVVARRDADEHAGVAARETLGGDARGL